MLGITNQRYPHAVRITRRSRPQACVDDPFADVDEGEADPIVIYDGVGRSYTNTTTTGSNKVESNKREISLPVRFDEWGANMYPLDGDEVEVRMGSIVEAGTVKDFEPDNNRSIVYWELLRV